MKGKSARMEIKDLGGFEGQCDVIYLSKRNLKGLRIPQINFLNGARI
jgi:hypothetical protein